MAVSKIKSALISAEQQITGLTHELAMREEREAELVAVIAELHKPMKVLSNNLYNFVGDLEVETVTPDPGIEERLGGMRQAQVIMRARLLIAMAARRLEEHHLEAEELKLASADVVRAVNANRVALEESQFRRNVLLIHGIAVTPQEMRQIAEMENVYQYNGCDLSLDEINEVQDIELDDHDVGEEDKGYDNTAMGKMRGKAGNIRAKLTKKHRASLRLN